MVANIFTQYLESYRQEWSDKERIFINAFREYLVLSRFSCFPEDAMPIFSALCKLHFGYYHKEIQELVYRQAVNHCANFIGKDGIEPLTDDELKAVNEYNSILFGKFQKA